jgi:hypothetical protein
VNWCCRNEFEGRFGGEVGAGAGGAGGGGPRQRRRRQLVERHQRGERRAQRDGRRVVELSAALLAAPSPAAGGGCGGLQVDMTLLLLPPSELISSVPKLRINKQKTLTQRDTLTYIPTLRMRARFDENERFVCQRKCLSIVFIVYS